MYEQGETVKRYADIWVGAISPRPAGVPANAKLRIIITERYLTLGWQAGSDVQRMDIEIAPEDTDKVTYAGGEVGIYTVGRAAQCGTCGSRKAANYDFFPGIIFTDDWRKDQAIISQRAMTGLPSNNYGQYSRP